MSPRLSSVIRWSSTALLTSGGLYCLGGTLMAIFQKSRPELPPPILAALSVIGLWWAVLCFLSARSCLRRRYRMLFAHLAPIGALLVWILLSKLLRHPVIENLTHHHSGDPMVWALDGMFLLIPLATAVMFYRFCRGVAQSKAQPLPAA